LAHANSAIVLRGVNAGSLSLRVLSSVPFRVEEDRTANHVFRTTSPSSRAKMAGLVSRRRKDGPVPLAERTHGRRISLLQPRDLGVLVVRAPGLLGEPPLQSLDFESKISIQSSVRPRRWNGFIVLAWAVHGGNDLSLSAQVSA